MSGEDPFWGVNKPRLPEPRSKPPRPTSASRRCTKTRSKSNRIEALIRLSSCSPMLRSPLLTTTKPLACGWFNGPRSNSRRLVLPRFTAKESPTRGVNTPRASPWLSSLRFKSESGLKGTVPATVTASLLSPPFRARFRRINSRSTTTDRCSNCRGWPARLAESSSRSETSRGAVPLRS